MFIAAFMLISVIYIFYKATGYEDLRPRSTIRILINHLQVVSLGLRIIPIRVFTEVQTRSKSDEHNIEY